MWTLKSQVGLPITLTSSPWKGLLAVEGRIEGAAQPEFFVLATGLNGCTLAPNVVASLKLPPAPESTRLELWDKAHTLPQSLLKSLQINGATFENVRVANADVHALITGKPRPDTSPSGWLGTPFLAAFQVTFDASNQRVVLEAPNAPPPKGSEIATVPFILKEGRIWVKASLEGGKSFSALLDTGTAGTLIPTAVGTTLPTTGQRTTTFKGANGKEGKAVQTPLPKLRVGEIEVLKMAAVFIAPESPAEFDRQFAVLGMDFIQRFKLTINYAKKRIYLAPVSLSAGKAIE